MSRDLAASLVCSSFMPEEHRGERIVAGKSSQPMDLLERKWPGDARSTLIRLPSTSHLRCLWNSDEPHAVKHLRTDNTPANFTFAAIAVDLSKEEPA